MSVSATVFEAFVSSPQDVSEERKLVSSVLLELNTIYIRSNKLLVWPVMWENLSHGRGLDPQDVINRQVEKFDVFIGILWSRFGTATRRAGSGTEEEFLRALKLADDGHAVQFLIFNRKSGFPADVDEEQLKKVRAFQKVIATHGILSHAYKDAQEFESLFRKEMLYYMNAAASNHERGEQTSHLAYSARETRDVEPHLSILQLVHSFGEQLRTEIAKMRTPAIKQEQVRDSIRQLLNDFHKICSRHLRDFESWTFIKTEKLMEKPGLDRTAAVKTACEELASTCEAVSEWRALLDHAQLVQLGVATEAQRVRDLLGRVLRSARVAGAALRAGAAES
ncbi:MAG: DUF4062 domain-containing protein [Rhodomicrobium sp.]